MSTKKEKLIKEIERTYTKAGKLSNYYKNPNARKKNKLRRIIEDSEPETVLKR